MTTAKAWKRRMSEAYDRITGATPDPKIIGQLAKIMERTGSTIDDDHIEEVTALMYEAFEAGQEGLPK